MPVLIIMATIQGWENDFDTYTYWILCCFQRVMIRKHSVKNTYTILCGILFCVKKIKHTFAQQKLARIHTVI